MHPAKLFFFFTSFEQPCIVPRFAQLDDVVYFISFNLDEANVHRTETTECCSGAKGTLQPTSTVNLIGVYLIKPPSPFVHNFQNLVNNLTKKSSIYKIEPLNAEIGRLITEEVI